MVRTMPFTEDTGHFLGTIPYTHHVVIADPFAPSVRAVAYPPHVLPAPEPGLTTRKAATPPAATPSWYLRMP